jgi:predicted transcriptional regulator
MARKQTPGLTEAELRLMEVLWRIGAGTVAEVANGLPEDIRLAYSSVLTTLRILERKGYLRHRKEGRAFIYEPIVDREKARTNAIRHLVGRFFEDSPGQLVLNLVEREKISAEELKRLREFLEKGDEEDDK